ncbi:MAG: hypothetical protein KJ626_10845 [Verrucomicrobia bacterium]|nr:hypothetical protein [Verrucomicrobiota bacterium]
MVRQSLNVSRCGEARFVRWSVLATLLSVLIPLSGCRTPDIQEPAGPSIVIVNAEGGDLIRTFSDADECPSSGSVFSVTSEEDGKENFLRLTYDIEGYGGFAVAVDSLDAGELPVLELRARLVDGSVPTVLFQVTDHAGQRRKVSLHDLTANLAADWQTFRVSLKPLKIFDEHALSDVCEFAFIFQRGKGKMDMGDVHLMEADAVTAHLDWSKPEYPSPTGRSVPHGLGAWSYGRPEYAAREIMHYNAEALEDGKIRYVFPYAGSITLNLDGTYSFAWEPGNARRLRALLDTLPDADSIFVLPLIDGVGHAADSLDPATWDRLAKEVSGKIENDPAFYGVQFDIEPHEERINYLFAYCRKYTDKPITAAVGKWTREDFRYADMLILMAYDYALEPAEFARISAERIERFLSDARASGGKAMVGVPAIATHREYEEVADTKDGTRRSTGHSMAEYAGASLDVINRCLREGDETYVGHAVWAVAEIEGLHGGSDPRWYYPTVISPEVWNLIRVSSVR